MAKYKFKLLRGVHVDETGRHEPGKNPIIESETDLVKRFGGDRYQMLEGPPVPLPRTKAEAKVEAQSAVEKSYLETAGGPPPEEDGLEGMSVRELKALAEQREIDLTTCTGKAEILNTIREALAAA